MTRPYYIVGIFFWSLFLKPLHAQKNNLDEKAEAFQDYFFEALTQKAIENHERAITALEACIALDTTPAVLYFELGKNYVATKKFPLAETAFKKALSKAPDNRWYLKALYKYYDSQNNFEKALPPLQKLSKAYPIYEDLLASLYIKKKDYTAALKLLNTLDSTQGKSVTRNKMRLKIALQNKKKKPVVSEKKTPNQASDYMDLIAEYTRKQAPQKAFKTAQRWLKKNPNSQQVHQWLYAFYLEEKNISAAMTSLDVILKGSKIKPEVRQKAIIKTLNFALKNPQYETQWRTFVKKIATANNTTTQQLLGRYYRSKNDSQAALKHFKIALKLNANNLEALQETLGVNMDLKAYTRARDQSAEALLRFPSQPLLYLLNAQALNALNNPKAAKDKLEEGLDYIIDAPEMTIDFYKTLAQSYTLLGNSAKAKQFEDKAKTLQQTRSK